MIQYFSADDIREFHATALERYGGVEGEHEPGQIEFMAEKPAMVSYGEELYPGLFLKAAVYMHGFAIRQFFADGNKRTAYITASSFLDINGFELLVDDDELYDVTMAVANGKMDEHELATWLEARCSIVSRA